MRIPAMWIVASSLTPALAAQTTYSSSGADGTAIQAEVDAFRTALGALNPNDPGSFDAGRREIQWDAIDDANAAPSNLAGDHYNSVSPRGVELVSVGGSGFQVSADSSNPTSTPSGFGHLDASYPTTFAPFSGERMMAPAGASTFDVLFFIAGSSTPAAVSGFGLVFSDVDGNGAASIELFGGAESLGSFDAPPFAGDAGMSFVGVDFGEAVVTRVRVTCGDAALAAGVIDTTTPGNNPDLVALDDMIYGEPMFAAVSLDSVRASLQELRDAVAASSAPKKPQKLMLKDLDISIKKVDKAIQKDAAGKTKVAAKQLKSAAVHLRLFEKNLDKPQVLNGVDEGELRDFACRAAMIGVDLAVLMNGDDEDDA